MSGTSKISIILPTYNEAATIDDIIKRIKNVNSDFEIIVVDDGSTDNSAKIAEKAGARVIRHPYNIGNGAAVKTGARNAEGDVLVFMDADGQHQPEDIPKLLEYLPEYDMVVGARTKQSKVSAFRTFGNTGLRKIAEFLSNQKIPDLTSGFRVVKKDRFIEFLHILPNRYSYPTTITIATLKAGYFIKYVPLDSIRKRTKGKSNLKPFRDGFRFINIMIRIIMLFNPQKIFMPTGLTTIFIGICLAIWQLLYRDGIHGSPIIVCIIGVFIVMFGLLAEQISYLHNKR